MGEMKSFAVDLHVAQLLLLDMPVNDLDVYAKHFADFLRAVQELHWISPVLGENGFRAVRTSRKFEAGTPKTAAKRETPHKELFVVMFSMDSRGLLGRGDLASDEAA